jgi:hypothetical protein
MEEVRTRQVKGEMHGNEGHTPEIEKTPSCEATMYGEMARGDTKFDDDGPDVLGQGRMPEAHTSSDN